MSSTAENIRAVALKLFVEKGYNATGLREISEKVGIKASSLYNHISNKEDLLFELMDHAMDLVQGSVHECTAGLTDPVDQLIAFCDAHLRYHATYGSLVFLSNSELRSLTGENLARMEERRRSYMREARELFAAVGKLTGAGLDPQLHTISLMAKGAHLASWYREDGELSLDVIVEGFTIMTLREVNVEVTRERIRRVKATVAAATTRPPSAK